MGPQPRTSNPEEEYFARREAEALRERYRREAAREELAKGTATAPERDEKEPRPAGATEAGADEGGSKIVRVVSTAMKAMFGIRGRRHRPHA